MIKENHSLFPTLVSRYEDFLSTEEINNIIECIKLKIDLVEKHKCINQGGSSDQFYDIFLEIQNLYPAFGNIRQRLMDCIREYENDYPLKKLRLGNSWFNIQNKDSILTRHVHPHCVLSGVIFLKTDNNSSKLYFENPNNFVKFFRSREELTEYSFEYFYFHPKPGTLLIFPSWLMHGSNNEKNQSDERIVLGFNTKYE